MANNDIQLVKEALCSNFSTNLCRSYKNFNLYLLLLAIGIDLKGNENRKRSLSLARKPNFMYLKIIILGQRR